MKRNGNSVSYLVLLMTVSAGLFANPPARDDGADFSGTWVLNREESDLRGPGGSGGRGGPGRAGGFEPDREIILTITPAAGNGLRIEQEGGPMERSLLLRPGAGPQTIRNEMGEMTVQARWKGGKLLVTQVRKREARGGTVEMKQEQTWELSSDGRTLTQWIQVKGPRGDRKIMRVFNRR